LKSQDPLNPANRSTLDSTIQSVEGKISTLQAKISALTAAKADYEKATTLAEQAATALSQAQAVAQQALATLTSATSNVEAAKTAYDEAAAKATEAKANLTSATSNEDAARSALTSAGASVAQQTTVTSAALALLNSAASTAGLATAALLSAQSALETAQANANSAIQAAIESQSAVDTAQSNYDNNLISDPTWTAPTHQVAHTRLVPHTETVITTTQVPHTATVFQEQVIPNILINSDFAGGNAYWSGLSIGWQNSQPGYFNGNIVFSYINQTVSQGLYSGPFENSTLTLSADWFNNDSNRNITDSYSMTVTVKDINQNPVGSATYTSDNTRHDWENKSITLTPTGPVSYITVSFSGIDNGYWLGDYGPHLKNPALRISHGQYVTETTYETVTTSEEVTTMVEETYYTTETVQPQTGLTVRVYNQLPTSNPQRSDTAYNLCKTATLTSINHQWGGGDILGCGSDRVMLHYTGYLTPTENITSLRGLADDGFYLDVNGVNAINNWTLKGCGGNWNPVSLEAGKTYEIDAWFYEWGGGACSILNYQSNNGSGVVPEAWYTNAISAPLIKDPALLTILEAATSANQIAQTNLQESQSTLSLRESALSAASNDKNVADTDLATATSTYDLASADLTAAQQAEAAAEATLNTATQEKVAAQAVVDTNVTEETSKQDVLTTATQQVTEATTSHKEATNEVTTQQASVATANTALDVATTKVATSYEEAVKAPKPDTELTKAEKIIAEPAPKPEPEPEEGSKEIPAELTAENLLSVNLDAVDPTELTEAQAEQLVAAALETFETAEQGSPEYLQALDALYLAAEQDDIELNPELAAIPGLAAAAELINFFGNAGADMSPATREESKKIVVTAVVAAGAAIQSAAAAASSASASSGGSSRRTK
jgi:hypothetical protein